MDTFNRLKIIFENNGIIIDQSLETNLNYYDMDSITFVSIIVDIEREFSIVIPDEFYSIENLNTIKNLAAIIDSLISNG